MVDFMMLKLNTISWNEFYKPRNKKNKKRPILGLRLKFLNTNVTVIHGNI